MYKYLLIFILIFVFISTNIDVFFGVFIYIMLECLKQNGIEGTGTIMVNRIKNISLTNGKRRKL